MSYRFDVYGHPVFPGDRSYWYGEYDRPQSDMSRRCDEMAKELQVVEQQTAPERMAASKRKLEQSMNDHIQPNDAAPAHVVCSAFNINCNVRIRVTPHGRQLWDEHNRQYPEKYRTPLPVDAEGWTRLQLWEVMHIWGKDCFVGCSMPFEATIELEFE